jgi:hypothetical protein
VRPHRGHCHLKVTPTFDALPVNGGAHYTHSSHDRGGPLAVCSSESLVQHCIPIGRHYVLCHTRVKGATTVLRDGFNHRYGSSFMDTCCPGIIGFLRLKVGAGKLAVIRRSSRGARRIQQFKLVSYEIPHASPRERTMVCSDSLP